MEKNATMHVQISNKLTVRELTVQFTYSTRTPQGQGINIVNNQIQK